MPFIGLHEKLNQRIDISKVEDPKALYELEDFVCPYCGSPLTIRKGHRRLNYTVASHFVHLWECRFDSHPESQEHLFAKEVLAKRLTKQYPDNAIEIEYPVSMDWRKKGRIADVMNIYSTGYMEAHEIQLSYITAEDLKERIEDYEKLDIQSFWYFGPDNGNNRNALDVLSHYGSEYRHIRFTYENQHDRFNKNTYKFLSDNE